MSDEICGCVMKLRYTLSGNPTYDKNTVVCQKPRGHWRTDAVPGHGPTSPEGDVSPPTPQGSGE